MKMLSLFLMTLALASAEVIRNGACPAVQPVQNFDLSAYAGTWYHVKKVPVINEGNGACETACYKLQGSTLKLTYGQVLNGVMEYTEGVAYRANEDGAGKLILNIDVEDTTIVQPLWVLDTDYNNYSISYSCKNDAATNTHKINLWVLSRTKGLRNDARAYVDAFINRNFGYIDPANFVYVEASDELCRFHTSRVYSYAARHY